MVKIKKEPDSQFIILPFILLALAFVILLFSFRPYVKVRPEPPLIPLTPTQHVSPITAKISPVTINNLTSSSNGHLLVTGLVRREWVFEGSFPIKLYDGQSKLIASSLAAAGDWTDATQSSVQFAAELYFSSSAKPSYFAFFKDNPSGLPQNDESVKIDISR